MRTFPTLPEPLIQSFRRAMIAWCLLVAAGGVDFFLDPSAAGNSSVRQLAGPLPACWSAVYAVGGIVAAVGVIRDLSALERPGLVMLIGAMAVNLGAIAAARGPLGAALQALPYAVAFWVFGARLRYLEQERKAAEAARRLLDLEQLHDRRGRPR